MKTLDCLPNIEPGDSVQLHDLKEQGSYTAYPVVEIDEQTVTIEHPERGRLVFPRLFVFAVAHNTA